MENLEFAMFVDETIRTCNIDELDLCDMFEVPRFTVRRWRRGEGKPIPPFMEWVVAELLTIREEESVDTELARRLGQTVFALEHRVASI